MKKIAWFYALPLAFAFALLIVFDRAAPAQAAGVVTDCSSPYGPNGFYTKLGGGGLVSFNCPFPGPTVITVPSGTGIVAALNTTVDGSNQGNRITLSGGNANRVFDQWTSGGTLTLTHLTLRDGNGSGGSGGCIINEGGTLVLIDVLVTHCQAAADQTGGGIASFTGTLSLNNVQVISNTAGSAGGIAAGQTVNILNATVADNRADGATYAYDTGGGGLVLSGTATVANSLIQNNYARFAGGGLLSLGGLVTLTLTTVSGNRSYIEDGGGINNFGALLINNSTLSGNTTTAPNGDGGGLLNRGIVTLTNSLLSGNTAPYSFGPYGNGGGLFNYGIATLANSTVSGNSARDGGGIANSGSLVMLNSTLNANQSLRPGGTGGGLVDFCCHTATLINTLVSGNQADNCGGIYGGGYLSLNGGTLSDNRALVYAGGALCADDVVELQGVTIVDNHAAHIGGGIDNSQYASTTLINTTLSGNSAPDRAGGFDNRGAATLRNVTLSNNSAALGGALAMESGSTITLVNSILAYSPSGGNCSGTITVFKYTLSSDNSCALTGTINGLSANNLDPLLTALGNYGGPTIGVAHNPLLVHMLKTGSPAIAGVLGNDAPLSDERGKPRPGSDGSYDIGAVERQSNDSSLAPRLYLPMLRR